MRHLLFFAVVPLLFGLGSSLPRVTLGLAGFEFEYRRRFILIMQYLLFFAVVPLLFGLGSSLPRVTLGLAGFEFEYR
jgi:uncharacterized membrane protein YuzA (DUF378 family)